MNTIILSCTQEDVYKYLYSDEGRAGSRNACPQTLGEHSTPCCRRLSIQREDGLYYHLEIDSRNGSQHPVLCDQSKTILWNEFRTLGYAERFHIDAVRSKFYSSEYTELFFPEGDSMT